MPRHSVVTNKSPLHPSALRFNDITVGLRIIVFNLEFGVARKATVLSRPFFGFTREGLNVRPSYDGDEKVLVVKSLTSHGRIQNNSLEDMGVIPYNDGWWNARNFTVAARKRHLLPKPNPDLRMLDHDYQEDWRWSYELGNGDSAMSDFAEF